MKSIIGVIDSGVGGLSVLKEAMRLLPDEVFIYLGDNMRCPYGVRPAHEIYQFTKEMIDYLVTRQVDIIVVACNTATAVALDQLKKEYAIPLIGVILPGASKAIQVSSNRHIGVIGTEYTINSKSYSRIIHELAQSIQVEELATQELVDIVENNQINDSNTRFIVQEALQPLLSESIDTLILGCTHFPLLRQVIEQVVGDRIRLVDSGYETAYVLKETIETFNRQAHQVQPDAETNVQFLTTGDAQKFHTIAEQWLQIAVPKVEQIKLGGDFNEVR